MSTEQPMLFSAIEQTIRALQLQAVSKERKIILEPLIHFIQSKVSQQQEQAIRINFICTHNSRRSHLVQVWAQALAYYFNIQRVFCYSGGTEVTALFPAVATALTQAGFQVKLIATGTNPIYSIKYAHNEHPIIGFSKKYKDSFNPTTAFAAVLTCQAANEACPYVQGADERIAIPFKDPKVFDNSPQQIEKYTARSLEIATELLYVFSKINA